MLELLKCPCCGDLPEIYPWGTGYLCQCTRYACNLPYYIMATDNEAAIRAWNQAALAFDREEEEEDE